MSLQNYNISAIKVHFSQNNLYTNDDIDLGHNL